MTKLAIVLGGADCVWSDLASARELIGDRAHLIVACNSAARDFEGFVDHSVTMHPDLRDKFWIPQRRAKGLPDAGQLWHPRHRGKHLDSIPIESPGGSSGMLCVAVAQQLGCNRIILAGVPMAKLAKHYDDPRPWAEARQYHNVWNRRAPVLQGIVKSMSGWTRDLLGAPTKEWIDGDATGATGQAAIEDGGPLGDRLPRVHSLGKFPGSGASDH